MVTSADTGRILVVDDEESIADLVSEALRLAGFEVTSAATGAEGYRSAVGGQFDLVVLDVMLPDGDGFDVCRRLRDQGVSTPVLFLTARTDPGDAARGLGLGADDYVRKPFHLDELLARVRTILRRRSASGASPEILSYADVTVNLSTYLATRNRRPLDLTPTEFRLLEALVRNGGIVLTRWQLLDLVWGDLDEVDPATLETVVSRLRRKLAHHGGPLLETRRGVGYGLIRPGG